MCIGSCGVSITRLVDIMTIEQQLQQDFDTGQTSRFDYYSEILSLDNASPQNIGLTREDYERAIFDPRTKIVNLLLNDETITCPILTPINNIPWYNADLIAESLPSNADIFYAPPIPNINSEKELIEVTTFLRDTLEDGGIVFFDSDRNNPLPRIEALFNSIQKFDHNLVIENIGGGEQERYLNQYIAKVSFERQDYPEIQMPLHEVYQKMVNEGKLPSEMSEGTSFVLHFEDNESDKIWSMYKKRFDELSKEHPVNAGFDEVEFKKILQDTEVVKVVNRVNGEVSTLCIFLTDLKQCPWLNESYFIKNYSDEIDSGNFLIFLGIVTDENMQGNSYATDVVDLLTRVSWERNASTIITFECNEISQNITPILVKSAIENSGLASVSGLEEPISQLAFYAIKKCV